MDKQKQVFLYKEDASLADEDVAALREAGFVPIKVKHFSSVKVIDPFLEADRSVVWQAAIEAIAKANSSVGSKTLFGTLLAEKLANTSLPEKDQQ